MPVHSSLKARDSYDSLKHTSLLYFPSTYPVAGRDLTPDFPRTAQSPHHQAHPEASTQASRAILNPPSASGRARCQLPTGIGSIPTGLLFMELKVYRLAELYTIADYATTAELLQILFDGGCWAQRQLRNGRMDVLLASKPRTLLTSLERVLGSMRGELY